MTGQRTGATIRDGAAKPDTQARAVLRLFEAEAVTWAAKYGQNAPLAHRLTSLSAAVNRYAHTGYQVLDLGCGTGELARALAMSGLRVVGCDISPQMLLRAARASRAGDSGGYASWILLEPDWLRLPFASLAFDVVVAASVLEYVADPAAALCECARVLRPGGILLYTVPDLRHPVRWAEWLVHRLGAGTPVPSEIGPMSRWKEYRAYLQASRQRHLVGWWLAVSGRVGLHKVAFPATGTRSALRLLVFCRTGGSPCSPSDEAGVLS